MTSTFAKFVLGAAAALALGGAAQAADVNVSVRVGDGGYNRFVGDGGGYGRNADDDDDYRRGDRFEQRDHFRRPRFQDEGRFYGRPVFAGPRWHRQDDCRLIVKRRVNPWGDVVVRRIRICD